MMQARRWLLFAAALLLTPHAAYAQKKKPPKAGAAPAAAPAPAPVNVDADADQPSPPPGAPPAGGDQMGAQWPPPSTAGDSARAVHICRFAPDAPQCHLGK